MSMIRAGFVCRSRGPRIAWCCARLRPRPPRRPRRCAGGRSISPEPWRGGAGVQMAPCPVGRPGWDIAGYLERPPPMAPSGPPCGGARLVGPACRSRAWARKVVRPSPTYSPGCPAPDAGSSFAPRRRRFAGPPGLTSLLYVLERVRFASARRQRADHWGVGRCGATSRFPNLAACGCAGFTRARPPGATAAAVARMRPGAPG